MNIYLIAGAAAIWLGSVISAGWWSYQAGKDSELAAQAREDKAAQLTREAASLAAAEAIAKIEVRNVTIRQPLETIVRTEQVFRDCRSGPDAMRLLNTTPGIASVPASAASGSKLP